jgi:hypothetical protein
MASRFDDLLLKYAVQVFGPEYVFLEADWQSTINTDPTGTFSDTTRPIIFASTLSNNIGQSDDFEAIGLLSGKEISFFTSMPHELSTT